MNKYKYICFTFKDGKEIKYTIIEKKPFAFAKFLAVAKMNGYKVKKWNYLEKLPNA